VEPRLIRTREGKRRLTRSAYVQRNQQILDHWEYIGGTPDEIGVIFSLGSERIKQIIRTKK
jgi:hypothetical protein